MVQVRVGRGVSECPAHRHDLPFVMKPMREEMMDDKRRSANRDVSVGEMKFCVGIESFIGQAGQVGGGALRDGPLEEFRIGDGGTLGWLAVNVAKTLKRVDPESFAVEDMNHLLSHRIEAKVGKFFPVVADGDR